MFRATRLGYRKPTLVALMALALCTTAAARANARPVWGFLKTPLVGKEVMVGGAVASFITVPGATTECQHFLYNMTISNVPVEGGGEITELPLFECASRTSSCTVTRIEAEKLPWPTHLEAFGPGIYLMVEGVNIGITYSGALCALAGVPVVVKGNAGGLVEETAQAVTFSKATAKATGTMLKVGTAEVEWSGVFPMEAFKAHREQTFEV